MRCLLASVLGLLLVQPAFAQIGDIKVSKAIDREIDKVLAEKKIKAAPPAADSDFLRRVYLDLLGRTPSAVEAKTYLDDKSPDKHHKLIDQLLVHPEMPLYWREVLNYWLNGRPSEPGPGFDDFRRYLQASLDVNKPWDVLVRELLVPGIDEKTQPASYFLGSRLRLPKEDQLDGMTVAVAAGFFGVRLECAKCHDHPYVDEWKQDHYYGLASFFNRTELVNNFKGKPALGEKAEGLVSFQTTARAGKTAKLMFLDSKSFDEPPLSKQADDNYVAARGKGAAPSEPKFSRRKVLVEYALTKDNVYFKRSLVNRVWKQLLGRGLVEPVDQIHDANPASYPEIMKLLADDVGSNSFDLRRLLAVILHSETYRRSSQWNEKDLPHENTFAMAPLRGLTPEQFLYALTTATETSEVIRTKLEKKGKASGTQIRGELEKDLKLFIEMYHSEADRFAATTAQALYMTYNKEAERYFKAAPGNLVMRLSKLSKGEDIAREAYLAVLSRYPEAEEVKTVLSYLEKKPAQPRDQACRDVVWALVNSAEFRFNH